MWTDRRAAGLGIFLVIWLSWIAYTTADWLGVVRYPVFAASQAVVVAAVVLIRSALVARYGTEAAYLSLLMVLPLPWVWLASMWVAIALGPVPDTIALVVFPAWVGIWLLIFALARSGRDRQHRRSLTQPPLDAAA